MKSLKHCALFAASLSCLAARAAPGDSAADSSSEPIAAAIPDTERTDFGTTPEALEQLTLDAARRMIGELDWHTSYSAAYRQARDEGKMLFLFFRDDKNPHVGDIYEREVLAGDELAEPLSNMVRAVLPLDCRRPFRVPEQLDLTLLSHSSFKFMYGRQGIAMIDLADPQSELHGHVVSAHPFTPGKHYTARGTKIVLGLPRGTVTQRALIYAVRLHPAAPASTTDGRCHDYLCKQARNSSKLMAAYGSVGHHDWGTRYGEIAAQTGKSAQEVAAMAGNRALIEAAIEVVDQWYGSPAHWGIMSSPASIFGYDLVRDPAGNWWGTGLFAN